MCKRPPANAAWMPAADAHAPVIGSAQAQFLRTGKAAMAMTRNQIIATMWAMGNQEDGDEEEPQEADNVVQEPQEGNEGDE